MIDSSPTGRAAWEQCSRVQVVPAVQPRKLAKVPFVELADGRLRGVVSSGSDISRVYVSSITAGTHAFSCSTNNNRPCGGLHGSPCKHLEALAAEAVLQYGADRVARYVCQIGAMLGFLFTMESVFDFLWLSEVSDMSGRCGRARAGSVVCGEAEDGGGAGAVETGPVLEIACTT
jgi:hypothetical protein